MNLNLKERINIALNGRFDEPIDNVNRSRLAGSMSLLLILINTAIQHSLLHTDVRAILVTDLMPLVPGMYETWRQGGLEELKVRYRVFSGAKSGIK